MYPKKLTSSDAVKLPLSRALLWILLSTLVVSGTALMGQLYYFHLRERRLQDEQYRIVSIVQTAKEQNFLKTIYLAELMDLSVDRPANLYQFNTKDAQKKLLASPVIKQASIQKMRPGTLLVNYQMRLPIAQVGDLTNTLIDEEGVIFPYQPFYSIKSLPIIYLGLTPQTLQWGESLKETQSFKLALAFLMHYKQLVSSYVLKQLDVTQADVESYGQKQLVGILENRSNSLIYLRLNPDYYQKNLIHFNVLMKTIEQKKNLSVKPKRSEIVVDLRIPSLAFIESSY